MSAERGRRTRGSLAALLLALAVLPALADEELPDIEFLEYLGSWEEGDDDWMLFDTSGETPDGNESPEDEAGTERTSARAADSTELHDER